MAKAFRIGVLADDFTGAVDVALAFRRAGFTAEITAGPRRGQRILPRSSVWVLDTESRHVPPSQAMDSVRRALIRLAPWRPNFIFKKIDSTLRGPLGAELSAFLGPGSGRVPVVPAFPRMGRTTVGGMHFVDDVPIHRTAFARDPRCPIRSSRVMKIFDIPRDLISRVWVPDIKNQADLTRLARECVKEVDNQFSCAVGSAGFAEALARVWGSGKKLGTERPRGRARVGVLIGSAHPASLRQADRLEKNFSTGADVIIIRVPQGTGGSPDRILKALVDRAMKAETQWNIDRWVATGGETAFALSRRWKIDRWRLVGGIQSGVGVCRSSRGRWLVAKPGGFGDENVLIRACRYLKGE